MNNLGPKLALIIIIAFNSLLCLADSKYSTHFLQKYNIAVDKSQKLELLTKLDNFLGNLPKTLWPKHTGIRKLIIKFTTTPLKPTHSGNTLRIYADMGNATKRRIIHHLLHQYDSLHKISAKQKWKKLSGWKRKALIWQAAENQDPRAYAEPSGLSNPQEDFVTSAAHFFLPAKSTIRNSIKCRMSKKFAFIDHLFLPYASPLSHIDCPNIASGFLDDIQFFDPLTGKAYEMGPINADAVEGFELLYATPGTGDASEIAGHLLLRIKLNNNPKAKQQGLENPKDLVVSFLADTESFQRRLQSPKVVLECDNSWFNLQGNNTQVFELWHSINQALKGLSGGFLTIMDRQTLAQTIKNYTIEEDRNLLRYELILSQSQKQQLLDTLYQAKLNYKAKYYFFQQNCASVLVKIIARGIKQNEIAEFSPIVSQPNSLLALFIRKGIAKPVYPSFYSYRKKGFLAQEQIKKEMATITNEHPEYNWPKISLLFSKKQNVRLNFLIDLAHILEKLDDKQIVYSLYSLLQDAEMVHAQKGMLCENYTTPVTSYIRQRQKTLLRNEQDINPLSITDVDTNHQIEAQYFAQGLPYTGLFKFNSNFALYHSDSLSTPIFSFNAAFSSQEMGSISSIAMQRGNFVALGAIEMGLSLTEDQNIKTLSLTGLKIRKFKERLDRIPSFFHPAGSVGFGLGLLELSYNRQQNILDGNIINGELLFNLLSNKQHNRYLFASIGSNLQFLQKNQNGYLGLSLPLHVESLWSGIPSRQWQWRNKFDYAPKLGTSILANTHFQSELTVKLGKYQGTLVRGKFFMHYLRKHGKNFNFETFSSGLGLEFIPW